MEYNGYYFYAEIEDKIDYDIFEPLMILLDEDFKKSGLGIKVILTTRNNDTLEYDYKFKLVGRMMAVEEFDIYLQHRLKQLAYTINCVFLISYKGFNKLYYPKEDRIEHIEKR